MTPKTERRTIALWAGAALAFVAFSIYAYAQLLALG